MIGRHHIGALGMMALALGVIPTPPSAEDRAAEKAINDLLAANLDPRVIAERVSIGDFITHSRLVLDMQLVMRAMGREMTTSALLDEVERFIRGESEIVQLGKAYPAAPASTPGVIDLQPMYDLGARRVTIGDERGVPLAHVTLREGAKTLHPRDVLSMRPVLGNRIPGPRMDVAAEIASEAMKTLNRAPKPAKEPRDRSAQRPEQAQARAAKSRKRARKGWA